MPVVKLYGNLRSSAGLAELILPGESIGQVLRNLLAEHPALQEKIFVENTLRPYVRVIVNGTDSELIEGLDTQLNEDDRVAIFPPIAGGSE